MKDMTLTQARNNLLRLANEIQEKPSTVVEIVKHGKPVMALMSSELYQALIETLDILSEEGTLPQLRKALLEIGKGRGVAWKTVKRRLGTEE